MRLMDDTGKGDFTDAFSPVLHASGLRILLAIAPEIDMFTDDEDISQAFTQGELQPGDGYLGNLALSSNRKAVLKLDTKKVCAKLLRYTAVMISSLRTTVTIS